MLNNSYKLFLVILLSSCVMNNNDSCKCNLPNTSANKSYIELLDAPLVDQDYKQIISLLSPTQLDSIFNGQFVCPYLDIYFTHQEGKLIEMNILIYSFDKSSSNIEFKIKKDEFLNFSFLDKNRKNHSLPMSICNLKDYYE